MRHPNLPVPEDAPTVRTPETPCPCCGETMDAATCANGDHLPKAGDFSLCIYCRAINIFEEDLTIRAARQEEIDALDDETRAFLNSLRIEMRQHPLAKEAPAAPTKQSPKGRVHIIPVDGAGEVREADKCPPFEELRQIVGGHIEHVRVLFDGKLAHMFVNELGAVEAGPGYPLPINPIATEIYHQLSRSQGRDWEGPPYIHGTAIVVENIPDAWT